MEGPLHQFTALMTSLSKSLELPGVIQYTEFEVDVRRAVELS